MQGKGLSLQRLDQLADDSPANWVAMTPQPGVFSPTARRAAVDDFRLFPDADQISPDTPVLVTGASTF